MICSCKWKEIRCRCGAELLDITVTLCQPNGRSNQSRATIVRVNPPQGVPDEWRFMCHPDLGGPRNPTEVMNAANRWCDICWGPAHEEYGNHDDKIQRIHEMTLKRRELLPNDPSVWNKQQLRRPRSDRGQST
jgi:hypothetical protein